MRTLTASDDLFAAHDILDAAMRAGRPPDANETARALAALRDGAMTVRTMEKHLDELVAVSAAAVGWQPLAVLRGGRP